MLLYLFASQSIFLFHTTIVVPKNIQPDPDVNTPVTVNVTKMGWSNDYAVYKGDTPPNSSEDKVEQMWVWFNKTGIDSRRSTIDVENFNRGGKDDKNLGEILWRANVDEKPFFDCYQKNIKQAAPKHFFSPWNSNNNDGYASEDDDYYVSHDRHRRGFNKSHRYMGSILTKWSLTTKCNISNLDFNRDAITAGLEPGQNDAPEPVSPGKENLVLNIYSKGTVVTSYHEYERTTTDDHGHKHHHKETKKSEHEFVDRIDYQLMFGDKQLYAWTEAGDSKYDDNSTAAIDLFTPMYDLSYMGGFWKASYKVIKTKKYVDPALAMLIAHLCSTEFSNAAIKADLQVKTPSKWPSQGFSFTFNF